MHTRVCTDQPHIRAHTDAQTHTHTQTNSLEDKAESCTRPMAACLESWLSIAIPCMLVEQLRLSKYLCMGYAVMQRPDAARPAIVRLCSTNHGKRSQTGLQALKTQTTSGSKRASSREQPNFRTCMRGGPFQFFISSSPYYCYCYCCFQFGVV